MADENFPPLIDPALRSPIAPAPKSSKSIKNMLREDQLKLERNLISPPKNMDERRKDELREFYQQINPAVPGAFLSQPVQVASLPGAFAVDPVAQAVQAARSVSAPRQSFEEFLESVPVEQARELSNAYMGQQNLAAAIAQMQANIDEMAADQLAAERGAVEEQEQIAAMDDLASAFGIGMEPTPDMGRAGMVAAWGNPADEFAESVFGGEEETAPGQMSTPFGVAMGTLGQNVEPNPLSGQFGPMNQHQMAAFDEDDPFGESPFSNAAPAFSIAPAVTVAPNAFANAQAELAAQAVAQEQAANMANISGMSADEDAPQFASLDPADPFGFVGPEAIAGFEALAAQQAANMANIGMTPDAMAEQEAQAQAANMANIGLSPAGMAAAAQQEAYMSALEQAAQVAEQALSPETVAEIDAQVAALAAETANMPEDQAIQAMMEAFNSMMADAQENADNAQVAGQMGIGPAAQGMMGMTMGLDNAAFAADPFGSAVSIDDPSVASSLSGVGSPSEDDSSPSLSPSIAAQSMMAMNAGFGDDPFGLSSIGFSDPMGAEAETSAPSMSDPTGSDSLSDDSDVGPSLGAMEAALSAADMGAADAAPSDPGGDAGAGADAGASGDGGGDAGGGISDGGPTGSGTGGDPDAWARGGRVKGKGLGAARGKSKSKSRGLAAMLC